jgi:hypothetical protein
MRGRKDGTAIASVDQRRAVAKLTGDRKRTLLGSSPIVIFVQFPAHLLNSSSASEPHGFDAFDAKRENRPHPQAQCRH